MSSDPLAKTDGHSVKHLLLEGSGRENVVVQALQECQAAIDAGQPIDRAEMLQKYPEIRDELSACLDGLELMRQSASGGHGQVGPQAVVDHGDDAMLVDRPVQRIRHFVRAREERSFPSKEVAERNARPLVEERVRREELDTAVLGRSRSGERQHRKEPQASKSDHSHGDPDYRALTRESVGRARGGRVFARQ